MGLVLEILNDIRGQIAVDDDVLTEASRVQKTARELTPSRLLEPNCAGSGQPRSSSHAGRLMQNPATFETLLLL